MEYHLKKSTMPTWGCRRAWRCVNQAQAYDLANKLFLYYGKDDKGCWRVGNLSQLADAGVLVAKKG